MSKINCVYLVIRTTFWHYIEDNELYGVGVLEGYDMVGKEVIRAFKKSTDAERYLKEFLKRTTENKEYHVTKLRYDTADKLSFVDEFGRLRCYEIKSLKLN